MAIHKGRINGRNFASKIKEILELEGFSQISSDVGTDGWVFKSTGVGLNDEFYIRLQDPVSNYLTVGVYEKYTPNPTAGLSGTFENGWTTNSVFWNYNTHHALMELDYIINVTLDRVIINAQGMKAQSWSATSLTYIGLPKRYASTDRQGRFAGMAYTGLGSRDAHNIWYALRDRGLNAQQPYEMSFYHSRIPQGWGDQLFFSPMFIGRDAEGPRGELEGIFVIPTNPSQDVHIYPNDEFVLNGKTYRFIRPTRHGWDTLYHGYDFVMEV